MDRVGILSRMQYIPSKGVEPIRVMKAKVCREFGMQGDYHGESSGELTLWTKESKEAAESADVGGLCFFRFKENLLSFGLRPSEVKSGDILQINDAMFKVSHKKKRCHMECDVARAGTDCPLKNEILFLSVWKEGTIREADRIYLLKKEHGAIQSDSIT